MKYLSHGCVRNSNSENIPSCPETTHLSPQDMGRITNLPIAGFLNKPLNKEKIDTLLQIHFGPLVAAE